MPLSTAPANFLRPRDGHEHQRVTYVELFFDLVFVFAVTQLSHFLLEHFSLLGAIETALMLMAVWWVWIYTSWVTNWLDPRHTPVRIMLFALMLAGLVLSTSIPQAFGSRGLSFALAYVFMHVGRCLFMLWCLHVHSPDNYRNFQRITAWFVLSSLLWIGGGLAEGNARLILWALGIALDYIAAMAGFWTPRLGRSSTTEWHISGEHLAERCGLFIIIALGESILVTGATFAKMTWDAPTVAAFVVAFIGSVAMWWIYFNVGAERGRHIIAEAADPGRLGRIVYTYVHLLPVAGIIVAAVADELVLAHPSGHVDFRTASTTIGGPALFLIGNLLFKRIMFSRGLSHMVGLGLLALLALAAPYVSPLVLGTAAAAVLVIVAVWETRSFRSPTLAA